MMRNFFYLFFCLFFVFFITSCERDHSTQKSDEKKLILEKQSNTFPFTEKDFPEIYPDLSNKKLQFSSLYWETNQSHSSLNMALRVRNTDGSEIYICRGNLMQHLLPGEIQNNQCKVTYGGQVFNLKDYEILFNANPEANWRFTNNIPQEEKCETKVVTSQRTQSAPIYFYSKNIAIPIIDRSSPSIGNVRSVCHSEAKLPFAAGHENNQTIYLCTAIYHKAFHVGKLVGNQCSIADEDKEFFLSVYEILYDNE